ncbi:uncharacterized protein LODBEIA_P26630 [Lodderomyces beijingensis]|uniref:Golgi pH regulator n=1 Tax=Lodderomyces beijingensis TaxID=1775926 RepID=A0ABP0ZJW6_9ASCO
MSVSGIIAYFSFLSATTFWVHSFVYNKNLIQKYSTSTAIPVNQINTFIHEKLRRPYNLTIAEVDVSNIQDDELDHKTSKWEQGTSRFEKTRTLATGLLFSISVSFSFGLILLMMCELGDYFAVETRLILFKFTIDSLMVILACVLPLCSISLLVNQDLVPMRATGARFGATICLFGVWFVILHKCGDLTQDFSPRSNQNTNTRNLIERKINEVSIVGITILAILSGIGSISTPYKMISYQWIMGKIRSHHPRPSSCKEIGENDINWAIQNLNNTQGLLFKRQNELSKMQSVSGGTFYNLPEQNKSFDNILMSKSKKKIGSILNRVQSFANLAQGSSMSEEDEIQQEIDSLQRLKKTLYNDLTNSIHRYRNQLEVDTGSYNSIDKMLNFGNSILAIYCIYRIVNVFLIKLPLLYAYGSPSSYDDGVHSEVIDSNEEAPSTKDALAITISKIILSIFQNIPMSETQLVNQLSFILSGSLFCCSFTNVLTTFKSFSRLLPFQSQESRTAKNWLKHLLVAEVLGVYVLATALLIRTNLPENLSNQVSKMLSLSGSSTKSNSSSIREVMFIDIWFDKVFAISCALTALVILVRRVADGDDLDMGSDGSYDEESLLEDQSFKEA